MPTLDWIGKGAVVRHHKDVPYRLLEPVKKLSLGLGEASNLIVQGDNLQALKALLPRYSGQIQCIYIDPPYNTGNEGWIYNDNVNSPEIKNWLDETVGKEGEDLSRHDKWLCMMYPRLLMLKQLLSEDGAIFVSIDDTEVHHLRLLMDEIFGSQKRIATFSWRTAGNFDNQAKVKISHEYILMYCPKPEAFPHPPVVDPNVGERSKLKKPEIRNTIIKNGPKNPVSSVRLPEGFPADFDDGVIPARTDSWPHFRRDMIVKDRKLSHSIDVSSGWSSRKLLDQFISNGLEPVKDTKGQDTRFLLTRTGAIESIKNREQPSHVISTLSGFGSTQSTSSYLEKMGIKFNYPKPVELVSYLVSMIRDKNCLVLDSFAGSGTTGEAVVRMNEEDGGNRKYILVEVDREIAKNVTAKRMRKCSGLGSEKTGRLVRRKGEGFRYCTLSQEPLFDRDGGVRDGVTFEQLAEFVWFKETGVAHTDKKDSPLVGVYEGRGIYLLYNGIIDDKRVNGGNVLTGKIFDSLPKHEGPKVIYAAACRLGKARLNQENIVFKQTPYALEM